MLHIWFQRGSYEVDPVDMSNQICLLAGQPVDMPNQICQLVGQMDQVQKHIFEHLPKRFIAYVIMLF